MKTLLKSISVVFIVLAFANCSKKGGGGGAPSPTAAGKSSVTSGASALQYNNDGNLVTITSKYISAQAKSSGKRRCLTVSADDSILKEKYEEIFNMINSSKVAKGKSSNPGSDSNYLTIKYTDGDTRKFNLSVNLAGEDEDTLSRGEDLIDYLDDIGNRILKNGNTCTTSGK